MELLYPCFIWTCVTAKILSGPWSKHLETQGSSKWRARAIAFSQCPASRHALMLLLTLSSGQKIPFRVWCCPPNKSCGVVPVEIWDFYRFSWFLTAKCILTFWCSTFSTYLRIENRGSTVANLQDRMKSKRSTATDQRPASQLAIEPRQAKPVDG